MPCWSRARRSRRWKVSATGSSSCTAAACSPPTGLQGSRPGSVRPGASRWKRRRRGTRSRRRSPPCRVCDTSTWWRARTVTRAAGSRSSRARTCALAWRPTSRGAAGASWRARRWRGRSRRRSWRSWGQRGEKDAPHLPPRARGAVRGPARLRAGRRLRPPHRLLLLQRPRLLRALRRRQPAGGSLALRVPRLPAGGAARAAAAQHAAPRRGAEARHARAPLDLSGTRPGGARGQVPRRAPRLPRPARAHRLGTHRPLRAPPLRAGPRARRLRGPRAARHGLSRLRHGGVRRHREPGGGRDAHLRRARLQLVRVVERGGRRRDGGAAPPPALALRSLLRLRAGRHRQPGRRLPRRVDDALPVSCRAGARHAHLAGSGVSRPRLLLGVQIATVVAILACVVALAALHPHRLDLTPERRFTLSAHTREVLARLHDDVRITAFYSSQEGVIRREMADLLALYQEAQPRITVRLLDLDRSPGLSQRLGVSSYNTAVVEAGERRERLDLVTEETLTATLLDVAGTPASVAGLLERFGIELALDVVVDEQARLFGTDGLSARVAYLNQALIPTPLDAQALLPVAQTLRLADPAPAGVRTDYLAMTGETAWADVDRRALHDGHAVFRPDHDRRGPLPVAALARIDGSDGREGRLAALGDADFVSNLHANVLGNRDLLLAVAGLVARGDALTGAL